LDAEPPRLGVLNIVNLRRRWRMARAGGWTGPGNDRGTGTPGL